MASATRMACNKEGDGDSGKSNGNEDGWQATATKAMPMAMATTWARMIATWQVGVKKGKGEGVKQWQ